MHETDISETIMYKIDVSKTDFSETDTSETDISQTDMMNFIRSMSRDGTHTHKKYQHRKYRT